MRITKIEVLESRQMGFPAPYLPAWHAPDGKPTKSFQASLFKISTNEGLAGYGPCMGKPDAFILDYLTGFDPLNIGQFWADCMSGRESPLGRASYGGLDVALWDIAGKAAGMPVSRMLGAKERRMPVYAATSRLLSADAHVEQVRSLRDMGFRAVKLRLHRQDCRDDLKVVKAVRDACPDMELLTDCNQNNRSIGYRWWSRGTAEMMAGELEALGVSVLEEPLGRFQLDGLRELADRFAIRIAGGEHSAGMHEFTASLPSYDVIQPDPVLGDIGVTGLRSLGIVSAFLGKQIMPHICSLGAFALSFAAALQVVSGLQNCPLLEYPCDPPFLTAGNQQFYIREPIQVEADGCVAVPNLPGIGVEVDEQLMR